MTEKTGVITSTLEDLAERYDGEHKAGIMLALANVRRHESDYLTQMEKQSLIATQQFLQAKGSVEKRDEILLAFGKFIENVSQHAEKNGKCTACTMQLLRVLGTVEQEYKSLKAGCTQSLQVPGSEPA